MMKGLRLHCMAADAPSQVRCRNQMVTRLYLLCMAGNTSVCPSWTQGCICWFFFSTYKTVHPTRSKNTSQFSWNDLVLIGTKWQHHFNSNIIISLQDNYFNTKHVNLLRKLCFLTRNSAMFERSHKFHLLRITLGRLPSSQNGPRHVKWAHARVTLPAIKQSAVYPVSWRLWAPLWPRLDERLRGWMDGRAFISPLKAKQFQLGGRRGWLARDAAKPES